MPKFEQTKILPHKPEDLFSMVMDIESYPNFLPWCQASRIISSENQEIIAELVVKFKSIIEHYNSLITTEINEGEYLIKVKAISGNFKKLENSWRITAHEQGSKLEFAIDIELKSTFYNYLIKMFFPEACHKMMTAFESRADSLLQK